MVEAKASEYFQGACDHFLAQATEVPVTEQLVFKMELVATSSKSEVGSEHHVCYGTSLRLDRFF